MKPMTRWFWTMTAACIGLILVCLAMGWKSVALGLILLAYFAGGLIALMFVCAMLAFKNG